MLEEGISNHCHERVTVKAVPGPSLKVIETEFFLQLLHPKRLQKQNDAADLTARRKPFRHRLNALAIAGTDQARHRRDRSVMGPHPAQSVALAAEPLSPICRSF
jgi:hypothetical protein